MDQTSSQVDYATLFDGYWTQADDPGRSPADARAVAAEILRATGNGRILDVGCGRGQLVRALLGEGADAHGVDVAALPVAQANQLAPGRFRQASALALPFDDDSFDCVVAVHCLQHLHAADVGAALRELLRVARRDVWLRLPAPAPADRFAPTRRPRAFWEQQAIAAGGRRHPRSLAITPYEQYERDDVEFTVALEKLPAAALAAHPLEQLLAERDLHMDMLRETGRRADAHVARYQLAAGFVRPNDVVLDVACGLGYGAAVLAANSPAASVLGVDLGESAIAYATAVTGGRWPQTSFRAGDACALAFLADASVDFVTSFETLEHLPDPVAFLAEIARVLKPSGRIMVSVPHRWVDHTGRDPNPHHLHVYDWPRLRAELQARFLPEAVWAQTAGGGMKLTTAPRRIERCALEAPAAPAEWWLAMAMRSPLGAVAAGYRETSFPTAGEPPNVTAFARDYRNPWLVKAIVSRGHRLDDPSVLQATAAAALQRAPAASADAGASLCVLAYRLLDDSRATAATIDDMLQRIDAYTAAPPADPTVLRWQISLLYVQARLLLACGRREQAAAAFTRCARLDVAGYSPILATKTIDALLRAAELAAVDGDTAAAARRLQRAIAETQRLLQGSWRPIVGDLEQPIAFGLVELADVVDLAASAANALVQLPQRAQRPGFSREVAAFSPRRHHDQLAAMLRDSQQWASRLLAAVEYEQRQRQEAQQRLQQADGQLAALRAQLQQMADHNLTQARQLDELRGRPRWFGWLRRRRGGR